VLIGQRISYQETHHGLVRGTSCAAWRTQRPSGLVEAPAIISRPGTPSNTKKV